MGILDTLKQMFLGDPEARERLKTARAERQEQLDEVASADAKAVSEKTELIMQKAVELHREVDEEVNEAVEEIKQKIEEANEAVVEEVKEVIGKLVPEAIDPEDQMMPDEVVTVEKTDVYNFKDMNTHHAVEYSIPTSQGNKQVVFLKRDWVFANGISAGQNTASFSTISEFEAAQPIQKS